MDKDVDDDRPARPARGSARHGAVHPREGAQSVRRAIAVLRILAAGRDVGLPLVDVVKATGLSRPTAHRLVEVLVEEGIVERRHRTKRYAIGHQVLELALARPSRSGLVVAADPFLSKIAHDIGDTTFLTVRTGLDALCVARVIGTYPVQVLSIEVGARRPLGVSSAGMALLAGLPAAEAREIVAHNANRFDAHRVNPAIVLEEVAVARRTGYAVRHTGIVPGTKAISAAIRMPDGQPCAAITIAAIRSRLQPKREMEVGEALKSAARAIEKVMPT